MHAEGSFNIRVHGDATQFANGGKREDVGQRVGIVPDSPEILDVANKRQDLGAAICVSLQMGVAAPYVREEIDKQAVGCGQVNGILVVSSGELVLEVGPKGAKTTTFGSLQESLSESAVTRNLEAFCCVVCVGQDSASSIQ